MKAYVPAIFITLFLQLGTITGCSSPSNQETQAKEVLDITVSILPQEYFVEKIGGDRVNVNVMVDPGADEHTYEPKPQQLQAVSQAKAYITIGGAFEEAWLDKIRGINSQLMIIDSGKGVERLPMIDHEHDHEHENHQETEDKHGDETLDPHIWLSPRLAKIQAKNIYEGLMKLDPTHQKEYQENLEKFLTEIDQLDAKIKQNLANVKNRKFIVFHPAWEYFAKEYNLKQIPIEIGGQEPSAAELAKLIEEAKKEKIKVIFAQPELNNNSAKTIAKEIGGEVLLITPLAPNWSENLLTISETFSKVLDKKY